MGRSGFDGVSRIGTLGRSVGMQKQGKVYMGGAGISPRTVLSGGGISAGRMVTVGSATVVKPKEMQKPKPKVEAKAAIHSEVKKVDKTVPALILSPEAADECVPPMDERGECGKPVENEGLTETEKRAVEFFEAVEGRRAAEAVDGNPPKAVDEVGVYAAVAVEEALEESPTPPANWQEEIARQADPPPETEETIAARVAETRAALPELPIGDVPSVGEGRRKKRRRRRRGTEVSEEKRAEIQAAVEAASDAAANA